jgi:hypothetical protein
MDGVDISAAVRGIEIKAHATELTEVRLTLLANVEVLGEAARVIAAMIPSAPDQEEFGP